MRSTKREPIDILVVEDNKGDAELIYEAFISSESPKRLHFARDGDEALDFLHRRGETYEKAVRPHLILLDINMPRKSGTEVLAAIKEDLGLRTIPVVMLTSSKAPRDIEQSYKLLANAYVVKPDSIDSLRKMAQTIDEFWASLVTLPSSSTRH